MKTETASQPIEQMTPIEWATPLISANEATISALESSARRIPGNLTRRRDNSAAKVAMTEGQKYQRIANLRQQNRELVTGRGEAMRPYIEALKAAIKGHRPVSATAIKNYGVSLPVGWRQRGNLFEFANA